MSTNIIDFYPLVPIGEGHPHSLHWITAASFGNPPYWICAKCGFIWHNIKSAPPQNETCPYAC